MKSKDLNEIVEDVHSNEKDAKETSTEKVVAVESTDMPDWSTDPRYDPEKLLDDQFIKHMKKHSVK